MYFDSDEEEEQIVIITKDKKESTEKRTVQQHNFNQQAREGKGLLDMQTPPRPRGNDAFQTPTRNEAKTALI